MIASFNHTSFTVTDMDQAVSFWTKALGFEARSVSPRNGDWQAKVTGIQSAKLLVAHLYGHGAHIEFIQYMEGKGENERIDPNMSCAAHVCFDVNNIEQTWEMLLAAGAMPQGEITLVGNGPVKGLKAGYLRDPSGIIIELVEAVPMEGHKTELDT
jgi:catechol 2,3-dioxygenase-like lactoylglutathione lyase family enzyme